jgi:hypothetical protein
MHVMSFDQLRELGQAAFTARRWEEAYIFLEGAFRHAHGSGRWEDAFVCGINALNAAHHARRIAAAFNLVFSLREFMQSPNAPSLGEVNSYRIELAVCEYDLIADYRPSLATLHNRLAEIARLVEIVEPDDYARVLGLKARLAEECGAVEEERVLWGEIWERVERGSKLRWHRHYVIAQCIRVALKSKDLESALGWLRLLRAEGELDCPGYRLDLAKSEVRIARYRGAVNEWHTAAQKLLVTAEDSNWPWWRVSAAHEMTRALFLEHFGIALNQVV